MEQDGEVSEIKTAGTSSCSFGRLDRPRSLTDHCVRGNQSHREGPLRSSRARQSGCATHSLICKRGGGAFDDSLRRLSALVESLVPQ